MVFAAHGFFLPMLRMSEPPRFARRWTSGKLDRRADATVLILETAKTFGLAVLLAMQVATDEGSSEDAICARRESPYDPIIGHATS